MKWKPVLSMTLCALLMAQTMGCSPATGSDTSTPAATSQSEPSVVTEPLSIDYTLNTHVFEQGSTRIEYPQMNGLKGELIQDYINQSLASIVSTYGADDYAEASIRYTVKLQSDEVLSVLYEGTVIPSGLDKTVSIFQSVNVDIKSSNEITVDNFITDPEGLKKLLESQQKTNLEYEGLHFYFENDSIIFYYMPLDDSETEFVKISVKREQLDSLVQWQFGEKPAS